MNDREVQEMLSNLRAKLGLRASSTTGKVVRFLASTAAGLIGVLPGAVAGAIDSFIVEKLFPRNGIVMFINNQFPSINILKTGKIRDSELQNHDAFHSPGAPCFRVLCKTMGGVGRCHCRERVRSRNTHASQNRGRMGHPGD